MNKPSIIVGVGASAGGLEALEALFDHLGSDTRMAFVIVQHLSPDFRSLMDELLARHTKLPIRGAENEMTVEAGVIYLMPPKKDMIISDGRLILREREDTHGPSLPIDGFLSSLAQDCSSQSVAIILSGTGSDGSRGLRRVHDNGGLVIVQSEDSAKFDGMPRSAIETGAVDVIVPPQEIGKVLRLFEESGNRDEFLSQYGDSTEGQPAQQGIFAALQQDYGIDFRHYKTTTMLRRIQRRVEVQKVASLEAYTELIRSSAAERRCLFDDMLIGVTRFFRDAEAFEALQRALHHRLSTEKIEEPIRAWVCGCSTGEEAYSIAILIRETLDSLELKTHFKIFATDMDRNSLEFASRGLYDDAAVSSLSAERLAANFSRVDGGYQIIPEVRQSIVFAPHNALRDAPFTNLHLVTCRNLLIYLNPPAQQKVLSLLHFGLQPQGLMFLGSSESAGELLNEVQTLDASAKLYQKIGSNRGVLGQKFAPPSQVSRDLHLSRTAIVPKGFSGVSPELAQVYDLMLGKELGAGILVNQEGSIVHVLGDASRFLVTPTGRISTRLADLLHPDLRLAVTGLVQRARTTLEPVQIQRLTVQFDNGESEPVKLIASPHVPQSGRAFVLVRIEKLAPQPERPLPIVDNESLGQSASRQISELTIELDYTKGNLQSTIEQLETSNEELQSTNEEMVASNEELQSTNEELHSVNEELYSVNAEFQKKIVELTELNNDFNNLLASTDMHTVFLDEKLAIRFFTPQATDIFSFTHLDIGRNLESFTHCLKMDDLGNDLRAVLATGEPLEREITSRSGSDFLLRLLPYRAADRTAGVVMSLLDITARVESERQVKVANERFERAVAATRDGIWDWPDIRQDVMTWSPMCYELLGYAEGEIKSTHSQWMALIHPDDQERVRQTSAPTQDRCFVELHRDFEYRMQHKSGQYRWYKHRALVEHDTTGRTIRMTGSVSDIHVRKELEESLLAQVRQRDNFLAILSHELRNPLGAIINALAVIQRMSESEEDSGRKEADSIVRDQARHMSRLLDDLLDVSRISHDKLELRLTHFDLRDTIREVRSAVQASLESHLVQLRVDLGNQPIPVYADRDRIIQCQVNLMNNAIKFSNPQGLINYQLRISEGFAEIAIRDDGVGMSPGLARSVFEIFSQGKNEPRKSESGMGVGLALVQAICQLHKGTVSAMSDGLNRGSTFVMRLPLVEINSDNVVEDADPMVSGQSNVSRTLRMDAAEATDSLLKPSQAVKTAKRILLVDDLAAGRSMLAQLLELEGHAVVQCDCGEAALKQLRSSQPFEVALIDIGLPDISGHEVARRARESGIDKSTTRMIAVTGYGQPKDIEASDQAGFDAHLTKPIDMQLLAKLIDSGMLGAGV